jgi:flagellar biosynthesis protein FliP
MSTVYRPFAHCGIAAPRWRRLLMVLLLWVCAFMSLPALAQPTPATPTPSFNLGPAFSAPSSAARRGLDDAVRSAVMLTALSLLPALVISMTAFLRIVLVLAMVRHAFGMPETPPNVVLIGLALFLAAFTMMPTLEALHRESIEPFMNDRLALREALDRGVAPLREFMLKQTREDDLRLMFELSKRAPPSSPEEVSLLQLTPAFMLNELRVAFQISFVIMLPFLLIDLVVSSVMLALGMLMVPPATITLPLKVLLFVLIDGWALVVRGVVGSFH